MTGGEKNEQETGIHVPSYRSFLTLSSLSPLRSPQVKQTSGHCRPRVWCCSLETRRSRRQSVVPFFPLRFDLKNDQKIMPCLSNRNDRTCVCSCACVYAHADTKLLTRRTRLVDVDRRQDCSLMKGNENALSAPRSFLCLSPLSSKQKPEVINDPNVHVSLSVSLQRLLPLLLLLLKRAGTMIPLLKFFHSLSLLL